MWRQSMNTSMIRMRCKSSGEWTAFKRTTRHASQICLSSQLTHQRKVNIIHIFIAAYSSVDCLAGIISDLILPLTMCLESPTSVLTTHHSSGTYGMINTTISKGKGVAGEWEYVMAPPPPEGAEKPKKEEITPFRPSNAHVAKRTNHIPYLHDPLDPKLQKEHDRKV